MKEGRFYKEYVQLVFTFLNFMFNLSKEKTLEKLNIWMQHNIVTHMATHLERNPLGHQSVYPATHFDESS
jgi:hypothetical protein